MRNTWLLIGYATFSAFVGTLILLNVPYAPTVFVSR